MRTFKIILLMLMAGFFTNSTLADKKNTGTGKNTFIEGELFISVKEEIFTANLTYAYVAKDSTRSGISFFLTPEMQIKEVKGENVKDFTFDTEAKPFATLKIDFKTALKEGEEMDFSISYSGKPAQGFWIEEYQWIDIDPDFMILPVFNTLESFDYQLQASVDSHDYYFIDIEKGELGRDFQTASQSPSYYFNPVWLSDNKANGMELINFEAADQQIKIFTVYTDSADYVANAALRIFDFFNSTFVEEDQVNSCSLLYRPLPFSLHRMTRSFRPSIVIARSHANIGTLAHEISHFWWNRGDALTTEKWLSESFAQYSEMMFIRHEQGEEIFNEIVQDLAKLSAALPPLLGADRFSRYGNDLIYCKGPYLLFKLEKEIGREEFVRFMVELNRQQVATTSELLVVLEILTSEEVRNEFEEWLNH